MASPRPLRIPGFDYRGCHRYSLTCCTFNRRRHFESRELVTTLVMQLAPTAQRQGFEHLAYTFMPDHLHLIVQGTRETANLRAFMRVLRQRMSVDFHRFAPGTVLWQDGYFERVLRRDEDLPLTIEYVLNNPVRAGLVERPEDYPYSWSRYGST